MLGDYTSERKELNKKVIKTVNEKDVKFLYLQFTDIQGVIKSFEVPSNRLEDILENGENFDGSSITGYGAIEESDKIALPDPNTFYLIPWRKDKGTKVGRFFCNVYNPDGTRYAGDPRYILEKMVKKAKEHGYEFNCAPEMEFFIIEKNGKNEISPGDMRGYFDYDPYDMNERMRFQIAKYCNKMGISIEALHHEVATGQHEVDFKYDTPVKTADNTNTIKMIIKTVAAENNMTATFMPKPFNDINGSGMHVHQSLWKNGKNIFYNAEKENHISNFMKKWINGQLKHAEEMTAVLNSWPNSYKRLIPGYEAPVYIAWGYKNRSPLIRVPSFGNKPNAARCEIRCPDPAGNPYLQIAVLLATGLDGVLNEEVEEFKPTDKNVYNFRAKDLIKQRIKSLPRNLNEALKKFKQSKLMKEVFGEQAFKNYYYAKLEENDKYSKHVSEWERKRYIRL